MREENLSLRAKYNITAMFYDILDYPWERTYRKWRPQLLGDLRGKVLEEVLKQDQNTPIPMEDEVLILHALHSGFLDDTSAADVRRELDALVERVHLNCPELLVELRQSQEMSDNIKEGFDEQIARYRATAL